MLPTYLEALFNLVAKTVFNRFAAVLPILNGLHAAAPIAAARLENTSENVNFSNEADDDVNDDATSCRHHIDINLTST